MTKLAAACRTDDTAFEEVDFTEAEQQIFSEGVEAIQAAPAQMLPGTYDFGRHRRLLDLGGGTGSWLVAVLRQYSALEATLFELPGAATVARQKWAGDAVAGRMRIVAGNFFTDPIPDDHDAVLVANVIHLYTPERNLALLRTLRQRVPAGARLLLVDFWTDPTHTQPLFAALMAGEFLLYGGDVYSVDEAHQWLAASGWRPVEHRPLAGPVSLLVAETARS